MNAPTTPSVALLRNAADSASSIDSLCFSARREINAKQANRPDELEHSAKLLRAIQDLQLARTILNKLIRDLENATGWDSKRD